jgi:hypothetical protein
MCIDGQYIVIRHVLCLCWLAYVSKGIMPFLNLMNIRTFTAQNPSEEERGAEMVTGGGGGGGGLRNFLLFYFFLPIKGSFKF